MRLIDADALAKKAYEVAYPVIHGWNDHERGLTLAGIAQLLDEAPTIDAVPVVRCGECKHSEPWYGDRSRCFLWVEDGISVFNDGFCSYGKRKDGADNE